MSARKVLALIAELPEDSSTVSSIRGGSEFKGWDVHAYLLANIIDSVRENTWVLASANSKKKLKRPEPTYRPSAKKKKTSAFAAMARAAYRKPDN